MRSDEEMVVNFADIDAERLRLLRAAADTIADLTYRIASSREEERERTT
jgi:hypothetical protein